MKITDEKILEEYNFHYNQSEVEFNLGNYEKSIDECMILWNLIPNFKESYSESYYVAKDLFRLNYMIKNYEVACNWSKILLACDLERFEDGEREFFYGKINYDLGNSDIAKEYLNIANKKSKGRCFIGEDKKYKLYIK